MYCSRFLRCSSKNLKREESYGVHNVINKKYVTHIFTYFKWPGVAGASGAVERSTCSGPVTDPGHPRMARAIHRWPGIREWPGDTGPFADPWMAWLCLGPFTDNPPHAKSPAVHNTDRILDSTILLIQISYLPVCATHEFSLQ